VEIHFGIVDPASRPYPSPPHVGSSHDCCDLRERENEDEVEEELERSDALPALGVLLAHSRTLLAEVGQPRLEVGEGDFVVDCLLDLHARS
jgi:hypothetical protein